MRKIIIVLVLFTSLNALSQTLKPVKWSGSVVKISDAEYELIATASIEPNWHLYAQDIPKDGPVPTSFTFIENPNYLKDGNTLEEEGHVVDDKFFGMKIKYFEDNASFKQRIILKNKTTFSINCIVEFMVCDDTRCLPPTEVELVFNVP